MAKKVKVRTHYHGRTPVTALKIQGHLAIHHTLKQGDRGWESVGSFFTISHIPTGAAIITELSSQEVAEKCLEWLNAEFSRNAIDLGKINSLIREDSPLRHLLRDIRNQAIEHIRSGFWEINKHQP